MGIIRTDKAFVLRPYSVLSVGEETNPGYEFEGWNTEADGSGTAVAGGSAYRPPNDITLYAMWRRKELSVDVTVYGRDGDFSSTFVEPAGAHTTTARDNAFTFTRPGGTGQLKASSPGLLVQAAEGQTFGGRPGIVRLDGDVSERTFDFTVGEFTRLYVSKIPVGRTLTLDGARLDRTRRYGDGGTLFGGHRYVLHWYADCRYALSGGASTPSPYEFDRGDACFINVAHMGKDAGHVLHAWVGYVDARTGEATEAAAFDVSGIGQSGPGEWRNYHTCEFGELEFDFRDRPRTDRYVVAYGVRDAGADAGAACAGAKFEGKYRIYLADDGGDGETEGEC